MPLLMSPKGTAVTLAQLQAIPAPPATDSWHPVPHASVFTIVSRLLAAFNMKAIDTQHFLSENNQRYLGSITIETPHSDSEFGIVIQSSTNKSVPYRLYFGENIRMCSNGCLFGSNIQTIRRKHTIPQDQVDATLSALTLPILASFNTSLQAHLAQRNLFRSTPAPTGPALSHLLVEAVRQDLIPGEKILPTLAYFNDPASMTRPPSSQSEIEAPSEAGPSTPTTQPQDGSFYAPGSLFCLHSAFTATFRDRPSPFRLPERSAALTSLLSPYTLPSPATTVVAAPLPTVAPDPTPSPLLSDLDDSIRRALQ